MAEAYPNSRFVGLDISVVGLAAGASEADFKGLDNVQFEQQDLTRAT
jgi:tRNA G46 methylase TrmB